MRFDTRLVHAGDAPPGSGDVVPPVHLSVVYERELQDPVRYFYGRGENPTREGLERCLAALEEVGYASVFPSGQAAASTVLAVLGRDRPVIASDDLYGGTRELFAAVLEPEQVRHVDLADPAVVARVLSGPSARDALIWVETPTNPMLKVADLHEIARRGHERAALVVVDNTLPSPALQQPLAWGADVSVYSTTKAVAGHLDVLGGALVHDRADLHEAFTAHRTVLGNVPGALDCFLVHRGLRTLAVRVARQVDSAVAVAALLHDSPHVAEVHYPGLRGHPQHALAARQMSGPGFLVTFRYRGDAAAMIARLRLFTHAVSLGGVRSLAQRPAAATHRCLPVALRQRLGLTDDLVRLSVGIEDPRDLLDDLTRALRPPRDQLGYGEETRPA